MISKQLGIKLSALTLALMLAGCGGGGSKGYFNSGTDSSSTPENPEQPQAINQLDSLRIDLDKPTLTAVNDTLVVTVKALSVNKGGLADMPVTLKIIDSTNLVLNKGIDTVKTDENGNAQFTLQTLNNLNISELVKNGFSIEAFVASKNISQTQKINVSGSDTSEIVEKNIVVLNATKNTVNVRDDKSTITVKVLNQNGETLPEQKVSLRVEDAENNGVYLTNMTPTTDTNGNATFDLIINENLRKGLTANQLVTAGINLTAIVTGTNGQVTTQTYKVNVIDSAVPVADGTIVIAYNPTEIVQYDPDEGNFYAKNAVVTVTDKDGKPLANQNVTMTITPTLYRFGEYVWGAAIPDDVESPKWLHPLTYSTYYDRTYFTMGIDSDGKEIKIFKPLSNIATTCSASNKTIVNGKSLQVATLIGQEENVGSTLSYKTDSKGKFNLQVRYPKIYATWVGIELSATTMTGTNTIKGVESIPLNAASTDFSTNGTYGPNLISPFGKMGNCS